MNKSTQNILAAGAVAVVGYLVWKNRKPKQAKVVGSAPLPNDVPQRFNGVSLVHNVIVTEPYWIAPDGTFHTATRGGTGVVGLINFRKITKEEYLGAWQSAKNKQAKPPKMVGHPVENPDLSGVNEWILSKERKKAEKECDMIMSIGGFAGSKEDRVKAREKCINNKLKK
tara:strand:- start:461 stop:970 length:510 start_codon:yes stop_codon:yes gene_type:complete